MLQHFFLPQLAFCCLALAPGSMGFAAPAETGALIPPDGHFIFFAIGTGSQIYEAQRTEDGTLGWKLKQPEAVLQDAASQVLGRHGAGPTWELNDGSSIHGDGKPIQVLTQPNAIPWLLLRVNADLNHPGRLSKVRYVVRLASSGGVAPSLAPEKEGALTKSAYQAVYLFFE